MSTAIVGGNARSLSSLLAELGYTHEPRANGRRSIRQHGIEVFAGTAHDVRAWLRETGRVIP